MLQQYCFIPECDINSFTRESLAIAKTIIDVIAVFPYARPGSGSAAQRESGDAAPAGPDTNCTESGKLF
jgi:hypothetical protein